MTSKERILSLVSEEMSSQLARFGEQNHIDTLEPVTHYEHAARHMKELYERRARSKTLAWDVIMLEELYEALELSHPSTLAMRKHMVEELVQVAAVALSWALAVERREI